MLNHSQVPKYIGANFLALSPTKVLLERCMNETCCQNFLSRLLRKNSSFHFPFPTKKVKIVGQYLQDVQNKDLGKQLPRTVIVQLENFFRMKYTPCCSFFLSVSG